MEAMRAEQEARRAGRGVVRIREAESEAEETRRRNRRRMRFRDAGDEGDDEGGRGNMMMVGIRKRW